MTEKKHPGLRSRIPLKNLKPSSSSSDDEDIFLSNSIADRSDIRLKVRYVTVKLKPSRHSVKRENDKYEVPTISSKHGSKNGKYTTETRVSPCEATSCESFHSCRSTISAQDVKCNSNEINGSSNTCSRKPGSIVIKGNCADDLLNYLTINNEIFLDDSVIESTQPQLIKKKKIDKVNTSCAPSPSREVCTEANTCQINHNIGYIGDICGSKGSTKADSNDIGYFNEKRKRDQLSYLKAFSESFEPVYGAKSIFEMSESVDFNQINNLTTEVVDAIPSNSSVHRTILSKSCATVINTLEENSCNIKFTEINPLMKESSILMALEKSRTNEIDKRDQKRRRAIPGCEESLEISSPDNRLSLREIPDRKGSIWLSSPKNNSPLNSCENTNNELTFDLAEVFQGDGDFLGFQNRENREMRPIKHLLKDADESCLRMMIRKSFKKLQITNGNHLRAIQLGESDVFVSNEESSNINDKISINLSEMDLTNKPLVIEKQKSISSLEVSGLDSSKVNDSEVTEENRLPQTNENEITCDRQNLNIKLSEPSNFDKKDTTVGNDFYKRSYCERPKNRGLSVIEEESSEESLNEPEGLRDDDLDDDFCLIDNNGKPIHLFDSKGIPLTDNSGRPLRSYKGKLLMDCDQSGIPVVDSDNPIFDMQGRQPHEEGFDPSLAPGAGAAGGRLTAGDGRPLLLFDARGRPLTSRSGTTLLDSTGRSLVQLTNSPVQ